MQLVEYGCNTMDLVCFPFFASSFYLYTSLEIYPSFNSPFSIYRTRQLNHFLFIPPPPPLSIIHPLSGYLCPFPIFPTISFLSQNCVVQSKYSCAFLNVNVVER